VKQNNLEFDIFLKKVKSFIPEIDAIFLEKVYLFSRKAHSGQVRISGEPYFIHPQEVALILAEMKMDVAAISAGLLHDVLEDTKFTYENLQKKFGKPIAELVNGVTKLEKYEYKTNRTYQERQSENFRKLLISITRDVRVILIKLADRLHNMRTLKEVPAERKIKIARETLDIYAPLANRFGLGKIKSELEDLSFKYLQPQEYFRISQVVSQKKRARDEFISLVKRKVEKQLRAAGIAAEIHGRSKHFYSIYRKKLKKKFEYEDIYDFAAIRIIVETVEECYEVLGIIQMKYEPVKKRFRDYIVHPKANNYQSLHSVVFGPQNRKIEVQIRTWKMHRIAEEGIAAHWKYKELNDGNSEKEKLFQKDILQNNIEKQINWIRGLLKQQDTENFIKSLKMNLYPDIIVAMTPQGDCIKLPKNSTPVDFAFAIHTQLGFHCIGAKVNDKFVPIRTILQTGDTVEIITTANGKPSKDWLLFMKSSKARQKIRTYFRQKEYEDAILLGEEIFSKKIRKKHYKIKKEPEIIELARKFKINDLKTFYAKIGKGELLFPQIEVILKKGNQPSEAKQFIDKSDLPPESDKFVGIKIGEIDSLMIRLAKCCHPQIGDEIIGYTTRGRGITVHRKDCRNPGFIYLKKTEPERIIPIEWDYATKKKRTKNTAPQKHRQIKIIGIDKPDFLQRIRGKFSKCDIELEKADLQKRRNQIMGKFSFSVSDTSEIQILINEILELRGVLKVEEI